MKVICIKNYDNYRTTIGRVYEVCQEYNSSSEDDYNEYFVADNGEKLWYHPDYFIPLEQWRENQLNKIGIE